jgi:ATP-binding cassette, subfamily B, vacuolar membrane transporter HMT1/ACLQ
MASDSSDMFSGSWPLNRTAHEVLSATQSFYAIILLVIFLTAFTAHSIATASKGDTTAAPSTQLGPGGKPLPRGKKPKEKSGIATQTDFSKNTKLLFNWLSVAVLVTFIANATLVILHSLVKRKENWWCGQAVVVSCHKRIRRFTTSTYPNNLRFTWWGPLSSTQSS